MMGYRHVGGSKELTLPRKVWLSAPGIPEIIRGPFLRMIMAVLACVAGCGCSNDSINPDAVLKYRPYLRYSRGDVYVSIEYMEGIDGRAVIVLGYAEGPMAERYSNQSLVRVIETNDPTSPISGLWIGGYKIPFDEEIRVMCMSINSDDRVVVREITDGVQMSQLRLLIQFVHDPGYGIGRPPKYITETITNICGAGGSTEVSVDG